MAKKSAGIVLYRFTNNQIEFLLLHPGGPFWAKKDLGAWSIPKGEFEDNEDPLTVAKREFNEELERQLMGICSFDTTCTRRTKTEKRQNNLYLVNKR